MLIFADADACRGLCPMLGRNASAAEIFSHPHVSAHFQALLETATANSTGSSTRVARAIIMDEPPSLDAGEITDKGSLNQRAVLDRRAQIVEELYAPQPSPRILRVKNIKEN
jgi:feruloyl-CoA synthase